MAYNDVIEFAATWRSDVPEIQTDQTPFVGPPADPAQPVEDNPEDAGTAGLPFPRKHLFKVRVTGPVGSLRPLPIRELPDWPGADEEDE